MNSTPVPATTRILVIDDDPLSRSLIETLLMKLGYNVLAEEDGTSGIIVAKNNKPDIILMDINMEGVDGFQATRELKGDDKTRNIPIIAVTAYQEKEAQAKEMGFDSFHVKPVNIQNLNEDIKRLVI